MTIRKASWWTPGGLVYENEPLTRQHVRDSEVDDWFECLRLAGYRQRWKAGEDFSGYTITVFEYEALETTTQTDKVNTHLYVDLCDQDCTFAEMFVSEHYISPFYIDKLPEMIRAQKMVDAIDLSKAILAFIRHGHGVDTIDRYGSEMKEEVQERERNWREMQRRKRDAEAKAKAAP